MIIRGMIHMMGFGELECGYGNENKGTLARRITVRCVFEIPLSS